MSAASDIGAEIALQLAAEGLDAVLTLRTSDGAYDPGTGRRTGATTRDYSVKAMFVDALNGGADGATRKLTTTLLIGQLPDGAPAPLPNDHIAAGLYTWIITKAEGCSDGIATYGWLLEVEAFGA